MLFSPPAMAPNEPSALRENDIFDVLERVGSGCMMSEDDDWLDELIREFEQKMQALKLRNENPHVLHLIRVLWPFAEGGLIRRYAIERVWRLRNGVGVRMPKEFEATVQSAYNNHCEKSDVFVRRNAKLEEALFYPAGRKRFGRWAVDRSRAEAWLRKKNLESG